MRDTSEVERGYQKRKKKPVRGTTTVTLRKQNTDELMTRVVLDPKKESVCVMVKK